MIASALAVLAIALGLVLYAVRDAILFFHTPAAIAEKAVPPGTRLRLGRVLLDGAHNPSGAAALAAALGELGVRRPTIVFGAMRGKDVAGSLRALAALEPRFVFTRVHDPGAHDPAELARTWRRLGGTARVAGDPAEALRVAEGDPIVVAGSLYLVGAVRGMITGTGEEE